MLFAYWLGSTWRNLLGWQLINRSSEIEMCSHKRNFSFTIFAFNFKQKQNYVMYTFKYIYIYVCVCVVGEFAN